MKTCCLLISAALVVAFPLVAQDPIEAPLQSMPDAMVPALIDPVSPGDPRDAQSYLRQADEFRALGSRSSADEARAAEILEVLALLYAQELGDSSQSARCAKLVAALRADPALSSRERLDLVAMHEHQKFEKSVRGASHQRRLAAWADLAGSLVDEFPDQPVVYEALLRVAENEPDPRRAQRIAVELAGMLRSPSWVQNRAQTLLNRLDLLGLPVSKLMPHEAGVDSQVLASGRPVLLYAWATWSPESMALAHALVAAAAPGTVVVGVNLDTDVLAAQTAATALGLPGRQIYDGRGMQGLVAQRFMINAAPLAYATDDEGVLQSVTGHLTVSAQP